MPLLVGLTARSINGKHTVSWTTKVHNSTSIEYELRVDRTTQVSELVSYILVVDRSQANLHF